MNKTNSNDEEGKELITDYLVNKGWFVFDTDKINTLCQHDLEACKGGKTIWIEIKKRTCDSKLYGDLICEKSKLEHLQLHPHSYLINIFKDGVWVADANKTPYEQQKRYAQKTAWYGGGKKVKDIISFKVENCKKLDINNL